MDWFFNGLGTAIIMFIIGLGAGGTMGYRIGIKKNIITQNQEAGDNTIQTQIGGNVRK